MRRRDKSKNELDFQKKIGKRIDKLILEKGYKSPYDFWINKAGDDISRAALNYIIAGKTDIKLSTLRTLSKLLGVKIKVLIDFE